MKTIAVAVLAAALSATVASPVFAHENPQDFPMPAATFERHVEGRLRRAKARMEEDIAARGLAPADAQALRQRFDSVAAAVEAETRKATADGTVTLDEARAVRAVARQLHAHRGHRHDGDV